MSAEIPGFRDGVAGQDATSRTAFLGRSRADVEGWIKVVAYAVPAVYALGFVIVSVHLWTLGIAHVEPIRPRAFATGALFIALGAGAAFIGNPSMPRHAHSALLWRPTDFRQVGEDVPYTLKSTNSRLVSGTASIVGAYFLAWQVYIYLGANQVASSGFTWRSSVAALVGVGLFVTAIVVRTNMRGKVARAIVRVTVIAGMALILWSLFTADVSWKAVGRWSAVVAGYSAFRPWLLATDRSEAHTTAFALLGLFTAYATAVYPTFAPAWGGGAPVEATLEVVAGDRTRVEHVLIIDETTHGFYLRTDNGESTLFLPRESVKSVLIATGTRKVR